MATLISAAGTNRPSLWFDEAATISAATHRSLPQLWQLLTHIDAVHGLYYLVMHGWFTIVPATEFWARLPSSLAVGAAAAGVVVLTQKFVGRDVSICAGIVFAILPRITWAGAEARPYAFSAMAAVWLTVLWVSAVRRNTATLWISYGLAVVGSTMLSTFSVLLLAVHATMLRPLGGERSVQRRWAATAATTLMALAPFLWFCQRQIRQVAWIHPLNWHTVVEIVAQQYFDKSVAFAVVTGLLLSAAVIAMRTGKRRPPQDETRLLAMLCIGWMVIPTAATLIYSVAFKPIYYPRYLIATAPAMAITMALAITTLARSRRAVGGVIALLTVVAAPNYFVNQRDRHAKEGWDYSDLADVIITHAHAGDCLLIDNTTRWIPGPIRALTAARPDAFAPLTDPGLGPHRQTLGRLWDGHLAVWDLTDQLDQCPTIWAITDHDHDLPDHQAAVMLPRGNRFAHTPDGEVLRALGFRVVERWQFTYGQVIKATR